jgi:hypothetical protein
MSQLTTMPRSESSRAMMLLGGAALVAIALFGHVWTRGDVALGLFGGEYCNGVSCETWSWTQMQVADRMTLVSYILLISGLVTIGCAIGAALAARGGRVAHPIGPRVAVALTAMAACAFVLRFRGAFHSAPKLGVGIGIIGVGLVLIWLAVGAIRAVVDEPLPSARVLDTHSR